MESNAYAVDQSLHTERIEVEMGKMCTVVKLGSLIWALGLVLARASSVSGKGLLQYIHEKYILFPIWFTLFYLHVGGKK
jgi:hypothetical protein